MGREQREPVETRLRREILEILQKGLDSCSEIDRKAFFGMCSTTWFACHVDPGKVRYPTFKDMIAFSGILGIIDYSLVQPLLQRVKMAGDHYIIDSGERA